MIASDSPLLLSVLEPPRIERRQCRNCYLLICGCKELDALEGIRQDDAETINADSRGYGKESCQGSLESDAGAMYDILGMIVDKFDEGRLNDCTVRHNGAQVWLIDEVARELVQRHEDKS